MFFWFYLLLFIHIAKSEHNFQYPSMLHKLLFDIKSDMNCVSGDACDLDKIKYIECTNNEADNVLPNWNCHANYKYSTHNDLKLSDARPLCTETYVNDAVYPKNLYKCTISFALNHDIVQTTPKSTTILLVCIISLALFFVIVKFYKKYYNRQHLYSQINEQPINEDSGEV